MGVHGRSIYAIPPTAQYELNGGKTLSESLLFTAYACKVDNPTPQWLHISNTLQYIPPGVTGYVVPIPSLDVAAAEWVAPPGVAQPAAAAGQQAVLTYYSYELPPSGATLSVSVGTTLPQLTVTGQADVQGNLQVEGLAEFQGPDPWFDVKHPKYGAIGNGVADDTNALKSAEAAAAATVGGVVLLPPGIYKTTAQLTLNAHIRLRGCGRDLDDTSSPTTVINYQPPAGGTAAIGITSHACVLEGFLLIQGNATATTTGILESGVFATTIRDVTVMSFTGTGLVLASTASASCIWNNHYNMRVASCGTGCSLAGSTANAKSANSNSFYGCQFLSCTTNSLNLGDTANENGFYDCDFSGASATLVQVGDGTHVCRGNVFFPATAEGSGANTTCFALASGSGPTLIWADCIPSGSGVKVSTAGAAPGWFYDTRAATWQTFGAVGLQFDASGNIGGGGASPIATGINYPSGWILMAGGTTVAIIANNLLTVQQNLALVKTITQYNNIATQGMGVPAIYQAPAPLTAQTAAVASIATLTSPNDGAKHVYEVSGFVRITTLGSGNINLQVTYTDSNGAAQTCTIPLCAEAGAFAASATTADDYKGHVTICVNPNTAVTVKTAGTFTGCTYNTGAQIKQVL